MRVVAIVLSVATAFALTGASAAQVAPRGSGFQAEYVAELTVAEDHLVRLAEAIPPASYS
jgi:hypothetical protein